MNVSIVVMIYTSIGYLHLCPEEAKQWIKQSKQKITFSIGDTSSSEC